MSNQKGMTSKDNNRESGSEPPMIVPGCWLLSRLSKGGQSGIFLSLIDTEKIAVPYQEERFVGAVLKSYNLETDELIRTAYRRELAILKSLPGDRNLLIKAWKDDVKGRLLLRWIDGPTLDQFLEYIAKTKKTIPLPFAILLATDILRDLALVHSVRSSQGQPLGIVHRDVCRQNVIISTADTSERCALLLDFGIATLHEVTENGDQSLPFGLGRPLYLAPEELFSARLHSAHEDKVVRHSAQVSDVYAAALVISEIFLGQSVRGSDLEKRITDSWMKELTNESGSVLDRISAKYPELPKPFYKVLAKALSFETDARYPNGEAFLNAWTEATEAAQLQELTQPEPRRKLTERLKKYASYLHRSEERKLAEKLANSKRLIEKQQG